MIKFDHLRSIILFLFLLTFPILQAQNPCTGPPAASSVIASQTLVCPGGIATMSLTTSYTVTGLTFQWSSATISSVGPYTGILGASQNTYTTLPLFTSTYFRCVITCTNGNQSTTSLFVYIQVGPVLTTSTVPYYESFEGITYTNQLPNCSWIAANAGNTVGTYTSSQSNNRVPRTGTNFAAFSLPSINNVIYSNGIQLGPGITYSAGVYFATEYFGYTNWTKLELLVGPNQSAAGLIPIATVSPAVSGPYQLLSGTFTVPVSGFYYVAIRATASSGNALYLSFDDLSVTIPCNVGVNGPTITVSPASPTVCEGTVVTFTASGADTYSWSTGTVGPITTVTLYLPGSLTVMGSNTLSGCINTKSVGLFVNPSPNIFVVASSQSICPGETITLTSYGSLTYTWGPPGPGPGTFTLVVSPTVTTCYSVSGANSYSCAAVSSICVTVKLQPVVTGSVSAGEVCAGEVVLLSGSGAFSYQWTGFPAGIPVTAYPLATATYTLKGTASNGCSNTATITVNVNTCAGFRSANALGERTEIFPNPGPGEFEIKFPVESEFRIYIFDVYGKLADDKTLERSSTRLDLRGLSNGIYFAIILGPASIETLKLIKE